MGGRKYDTLLNLYIRSPIWLEHSCVPDSVDMEVSFWTPPYNAYATLTAQQLEHSGEPSQKHSLVVFCHTPWLLVRAVAGAYPCAVYTGRKFCCFLLGWGSRRANVFALIALH